MVVVGPEGGVWCFPEGGVSFARGREGRRGKEGGRAREEEKEGGVGREIGGERKRRTGRKIGRKSRREEGSGRGTIASSFHLHDPSVDPFTGTNQISNVGLNIRLKKKKV